MYPVISSATHFQIPDDHLLGYAIYKNKDDPNPTTILHENGTGLADTDTVIYVRAEENSKCKDKVRLINYFKNFYQSLWLTKLYL